VVLTLAESLSCDGARDSANARPHHVKGGSLWRSWTRVIRDSGLRFGVATLEIGGGAGDEAGGAATSPVGELLSMVATTLRVRSRDCRRSGGDGWR
jgi:hypothetical protein